MSFEAKARAEASVGVFLSDDLEGLYHLKKPCVSAAIWRRTPLPKFQTWIDSLPADQLPTGRFVIPLGQIRSVLTEVMEISRTPNCVQREMLIDDIGALAHVFAKMSQAKFVRLRLEVITDNKCSKFHIDAIKMRLVCTYRGPGTQYCFAGCEGPGDVFEVPTGSPILMRGTLWPTKGKTTILHRSPPIKGRGETRLLLALDPVDDPCKEPESRYSSFH